MSKIPRYWFSKMYFNYSRSQRFPNLIFRDVPRLQNMICQNELRFHDPSKTIKQCRKVSNIFHNYFRFTRIYLDFKIIQNVSGSHRFYWDSTISIFRFLTIVNDNCVDPTKISFSICFPPYPFRDFRFFNCPNSIKMKPARGPRQSVLAIIVVESQDDFLILGPTVDGLYWPINGLILSI